MMADTANSIDITRPTSPSAGRSSASLFINGRFLSQPQSGVQRYAKEMSAALTRLQHASGLAAPTLLAPPGRAAAANLAVDIRSVGRLPGQAWEQFELPRFARAGLLLNLGNTASVFGQRQAVVIHDAAVFEQPAAYPWKFRAWYKLLQRLLARGQTRIVTVSYAARDDIARHLGLDRESIAVTGEGAGHILDTPADETILSQHQLRPRGYALAVGNLAAHKNLAGLRETADRLGRLGLDLAFTGGFDASVFSSQQAGLSGAAKYLGRVDDASLRALYENAACFVCPSFYEGFGLPAAEAMACGCPVVAADIASLRETCGPAAMYFDPARPRDIADAVERSVSNTTERGRLDALMAAQTARHSWDSAARRLMAVVHAL